MIYIVVESGFDDEVVIFATTDSRKAREICLQDVRHRGIEVWEDGGDKVGFIDLEDPIEIESG